MWKIVGLQWVVGTLLCLLMLLFSIDHSTTALSGVVAIALPSTVFAGFVGLGSRSPTYGMLVVVAGEFLKVGLSIAMLFLAIQLHPNMVWWVLVLAVVVTLKSYFLAFILR